MPKKLTTEEFITKSKNHHGDRYDYSKSSYINNRTKVIIICDKHKEFLQIPHNHIIGQGCPTCSVENAGKRNLKTQEEFIEKANRVHNHRYNYTKTNYTRSEDKVVITCVIHGDFIQSAIAHTSGQGCPECGRESTTKSHTKDKEWFIEKANRVHNFLYTYEKTDYTYANKRVIITCPIHGDFEQSPSDHLGGHGCRKCAFIEGGKKSRLTTEEFINKSILKHNNKYSYDRVEYVDALTKVIITCPIHGDFEKVASAHIYGGGCQKCGVIKGGFGFSRSEFIKKANERICTFYILKCFNDKEVFYKIGITMNTVKSRYDSIKTMPYSYEVISEIFGEAGFIWNLEKEEKKKLKEFNYQPLINFGGAKTECFTQYKK